MKETPIAEAQDITQSTGLPKPPLGTEISQQPTPWSKWYEEDHTTDTSLIEPADKVRDSKEEFLRAAKLSSEEKNILEKTTTIEDFISIANKTQKEWKGKRGAKTRDAIQKTVSDWSQLADNYKSTVDVLKSVRPEFGVIAWGTIGIVVAVIINKHKKEQALDGSIRQISQSLPRLDLYYAIRQWPHKILWLARLPGSIVPPIWLSHFSLERYEILRPEGQLVIHSSCIHGPYPSTTVKLLLGHFIYQILSWKPQLLRNRRDLEEFRSSDIELTLNQLWGLASNLIPMDTRVFWIIDRLDECKFARGGEERFDRVYEKLKNFVQHPKELKILVTSACLPETLNRVSGEDLRSEDVYELVAEI